MADPTLLIPCPACGDSLPPGTLAGHCPRCLLFFSVDENEDDVSGGMETPWAVLGGYDLLDEIGRGGMGVVYRARQRDLNRSVAVKVLLDAGFASTHQKERFRREAEAVARLKHPGIVAIHEIGESDGVPWFSMDHVEGASLEESAKDHPLPGREAALCLREIALAVVHAHERGVLHRDLKPSNILLDTACRPHVTDFGIAQRLDPEGEKADSLTRTGQSLGSPGYAAPELVLGQPADVRTDVYGLGTILYYLLTGRPPHSGTTLESILRQVRENDPVAPCSLKPSIPRDLETICLKCLRKTNAERYPSPAALIEDLDRFLAGLPILARPVGPIEITGRWCRRHPFVAAMLATISLLLVLIVVGSIDFARRQQHLEHRATLLAEARAIREGASSWTRDQAMLRIAKAWRIRASPELLREAIATLANPEMRPRPGKDSSPSRVIPADPGISADGRHLARIAGSEIVVTEVATDRIVARLPGYPEGTLLKLNENATRLALASPDSTEVIVLDLPGGNERFRCAHPEPVVSLDWSLDLIATGCANRFIYLWKDDGVLHRRLMGHESPPLVRFRPRGQELVSVGADKHVRLWHAGRGVELLSDSTASNNGPPLWWSPDGASFHFGSEDVKHIRHIDIRWPSAIRVFSMTSDEPGPENLRTMDISPDGELVSTSDDEVCRLWSVESGEILATFPKGKKEWMVTRFSPDGSTLWLSGWDLGCRPVPISRAPDGKVHVGPPGEPRFGTGSLLQEISHDGNLFVLSNNADGSFLVGNRLDGTITRLPHPSVLVSAISPDGSSVATSSYATKSARVWRLPEGELLEELPAPGIIGGLQFSPDGKSLTLHSGSGMARYRLDTREPDPEIAATERPTSSFWSRDGERLATTAGADVLILRADDFSEVLRLPVPDSAGWTGNAQMAFSADGNRLAVRTAVGAVVVYDLNQLRAELSDWRMSF
jgi:WD40 repeat protein/tRNA A-37 threonylcarbamoyl transferase component Bud32